MAFCSKCGAQVDDSASFCPKCGQTVGGSAVTPAPSIAPGENGMAENIAAMLCYTFGWVTGLIFFLIDKRPFVRFHAAQSMVVFGGLQILYILFARVFYSGAFYGGYGFFSLSGLLFEVVELAGFVLWVLLMVKAYQHVRFEVPGAAGLAESLAKK